ncbi:MAG: isopentenyl phosphate kinase family protein [Chloroflexi bacterium]|nr:isopentenyl phosphate kinase family protein [Chloroflexota bacterium]
MVFVKLGGSLITDKSVEATPRLGVIQRLAQEIRTVLDKYPDMHLLLGHGSGSFGHVVAQRYQVQTGCTDWRGYAETSAAASRLNRLVTDAFLAAGVPVVSLQPSASARCRGGKLIELSVYPIQKILEQGLVPLVYGDVAVDELWGSTIISTEIIFSYLAYQLLPQRIILAGEVRGVYSADPRLDREARLIPVIRACQMNREIGMLGGSHGVDVTGGMLTKVHLMVDLVRNLSGLRVYLLSGLEPGLLQRALENPDFNPGTLIAC